MDTLKCSAEEHLYILSLRHRDEAPGTAIHDMTLES